MDRLFFALGSASGLLGLVAGAFGAHALRGRLTPEMLAVYETAVGYQLVHARVLLAAAWAVARWPGPALAAAGWLFAGGTIVFSGSLYALSLSGQHWLGMITPLGPWSSWPAAPASSGRRSGPRAPALIKTHLNMGGSTAYIQANLEHEGVLLAVLNSGLPS